MKKITLISQFFPPDYAPTGQLLNRLTKNLAGRGFKFKIITGIPHYAYKNKDINRYEVSKNRVIIRTIICTFLGKNLFGKFANGTLFCINAFYNLIFINPEADLIIYTSEPPFNPLVAFLVSFLKRTKYLFIVYDSYPNVLIDNGYFNKNNFLIKLWFSLNKYVYSKAERIITLSPPMKKNFLCDYPNLDNKISVISSWADINKIKPLPKDKNWFVKKHNLQKKFVVLYSGNQGRCHDINTILETALLLKSEDNILFLFIGGGYKKAIINNYKNKNRLKNVKLLPYQDFDDLPFTLTCADIAIVSISDNADSLIAPSKLYGHLAAGSPIAVIAPFNSYLEILVNDNKFGKSFLNGDSDSFKKWIIELIKNTNLKNNFESNSREFITKNCSEELITNKYFEVINQILNL